MTVQYFQEYRRVNGLLSELCRYAVDILHANGIDAVPVEPTIEDLDYRPPYAGYASLCVRGHGNIYGGN